MKKTSQLFTTSSTSNTENSSQGKGCQSLSDYDLQGKLFSEIEKILKF